MQYSGKKDSPILSTHPRHCWISYAGLAFVAVVALAYGWVADDAYITFRVVDNAVHGFGLTWNIGERVQVYTHPLWMLLHIPFYALSGNIYLTTILLSLTCFVLAVWLTIRTSRQPALDFLCFLLPLVLLQPVREYAICGLENPLAMLLISAFANVLWQAEINERRPLADYPWLMLSLFSALLALTRLDLSLIVAPCWLWLLFRAYREKQLAPALTPILLGALPLVLWDIFCLWYYGFIYPNTKYAKLNTGIPETEMLMQGFSYLMTLTARDPLSFTLILLLVAGTLDGLRKNPAMASPQKNVSLLLGLGGTFYILYIIIVGGDFMLGRFFAAPLFLICWLLLHLVPPHFLHSPARVAGWIAGLLIASYMSYSGWNDTQTGVCKDIIKTSTCILSGVADERAFYLDMTGLFAEKGRFIRTQATGDWVDQGLAQAKSSDAVDIIHNIGLRGFYAGPKVTIIDTMALSDALLARLPIEKADGWRIGHFLRTLPDGYQQAHSTGNVSAMDPALGQYYLKLREVVSGDLWSGSRLRTIAGFQTGRYDALRDDYVARHCDQFYRGCAQK